MSRPDATKCPEHIQYSIKLFVDHGCRPGGFLTAVLSNDLFGAINNADDDSVENLPHVVAFIHQTVRSDCYGTKEKVLAWRGTEREAPDAA